MDVSTSENTEMTKKRATESSSGQMADVMKVSGKTENKTGSDLT